MYSINTFGYVFYLPVFVCFFVLFEIMARVAPRRELCVGYKKPFKTHIFLSVILRADTIIINRSSRYKTFGIKVTFMKLAFFSKNMLIFLLISNGLLPSGTLQTLKNDSWDYHILYSIRSSLLVKCSSKLSHKCRAFLIPISQRLNKCHQSVSKTNPMRIR